MYFTSIALDQGLFVVASSPPKAFLVQESKVTPMPRFFDGIRSPAPDWPAEELMVSDLGGTIDHMTFGISAPGTEYADRVEGSPGHWRTRSRSMKGSKATQASWVTERTISEPVTTRKGARFYEIAPSYLAPASAGFSFRFDGPSHGEKLPKPLGGKHGCQYAMLGHPFLKMMTDETLIGLGTLCTSGKDEVSTAKLEGAAPPFQSISPRLGSGHLAAEHWKDGHSDVYPLPNAEQVADFASFDFVVRPGPAGADELYVVTQVVGKTGNRAYVGRFDGLQWLDATPPNPPEQLLPFESKTNELYLFHQSIGFRYKPGGWEPIALEHSKDCGTDWMSKAAEAPRGDLFVSGGVGCLWRISPGSTQGALVTLPDHRFVGDMISHQGSFYMFADGASGQSLLRLKP